jgi:hypothetical protein
MQFTAMNTMREINCTIFKLVDEYAGDRCHCLNVKFYRIAAQTDLNLALGQGWSWLYYNS